MINDVIFDQNLLIENQGSMITNHFTEIINFLLEKNLVQTAIGLIVASQISKLTNTLTDVIVDPIVQFLTFGKTKQLEDYKIKIYKIDFKIGLLIANIINIIIVLIIIFYIWKLSKISITTNFIK